MLPFPGGNHLSQYYGTTFGRLHCVLLWCIQCVQPRVISTFLGCWVWAAHRLSLDKQQMWETRHCLKGKRKLQSSPQKTRAAIAAISPKKPPCPKLRRNVLIKTNFLLKTCLFSPIFHARPDISKIEIAPFFNDIIISGLFLKTLTSPKHACLWGVTLAYRFQM